MHLESSIFDLVKTGRKTIESRLFDEKRQKIKIGDVILFWNGDQEISVEVEDLQRESTFLDLFSRNPPEAFGGDSIVSLLARVREFYSTEEETKHGVLGIKFRLKN